MTLGEAGIDLFYVPLGVRESLEKLGWIYFTIPSVSLNPWGGCGGSVYSAAIAGVIHFSNVTSLELAKHNIRVNSISPGAIITQIFGVGQKLSGEKLSLSDDHLKLSDTFDDFQPIPRAGLPGDIADLAIYLSSDESSFVTGQDFVVDGGLLAGRPLNIASESFKKINRSLKSF